MAFLACASDGSTVHKMTQMLCKWLVEPFTGQICVILCHPTRTPKKPSDGSNGFCANSLIEDNALLTVAIPLNPAHCGGTNPRIPARQIRGVQQDLCAHITFTIILSLFTGRKRGAININMGDYLAERGLVLPSVGVLLANHSLAPHRGDVPMAARELCSAIESLSSAV
ncbi:hypothetical protein K438DRAFT_1760884 [Mycena galopus ATCC 62051]|nr:hypothetical protein K438DRAFT_1760884 [Mycena galopus ATCC 62051]